MIVRAGLVLALAAGPAAARPVLDLPLACMPGRDCWVQNYPDHAGRDWHDGTRTYPGHDGTDVRVADWDAASAGFPVLAAAAGTVIATRDGEADHPGSGTWPKGRECGNGVIIDHGDGWQTQYCHLMRGSIAVSHGQAVAAGAALGRLGQSGASAFPHVHLTVRYRGRAVDPFVAPGLWSPAASRALVYHPTQIITARLAAASLTLRILGLRAGDRIRLAFTGPEAPTAIRHIDIPRDLAQWTIALPMPGGTRRAEIAVLHQDAIADAAVAVPAHQDRIQRYHQRQ